MVAARGEEDARRAAGETDEAAENAARDYGAGGGWRLACWWLGGGQGRGLGTGSELLLLLWLGASFWEGVNGWLVGEEVEDGK